VELFHGGHVQARELLVPQKLQAGLSPVDGVRKSRRTGRAQLWNHTIFSGCRSNIAVARSPWSMSDMGIFQHLLKPIMTSYLFLNRLKKGVYENSVGILRFVSEVIEPALLKE